MKKDCYAQETERRAINVRAGSNWGNERVTWDGFGELGQSFRALTLVRSWDFIPSAMRKLLKGKLLGVINIFKRSLLSVCGKELEGSKNGSRV